MSKKKTIEFVYIKEGEETVKLLAGKLVTRFKQDHQLKPDECRAMLDIIANDGELDLPEDMKSTDKKYMKLMFSKLAAIVKESAKLGEALVAKQEKEKNIEELNSELTKLRDKRKQLEYQLAVTENESELVEKEFEKKVKKPK